MHDSILSAIGNTPLVKLERVFDDLPFNLYAKLEAFNPGGSSKDRPAIKIIRRAIELGAVVPGKTVIIESSSGNMGIGLAQACSLYGVRFICVVDVKATMQNIRLLEAYGAQVELVSEPDPITGEYLQARIDRVKSLLFSTPGSFWPNQYANLDNPRAHHDTMREIATQLDDKVDYLFCATSTCGTLRGCTEYIREHGLKTKTFAVDAVGSVIFGGQKACGRLIPGHGAAVRPPLFNTTIADDCIHVRDLDCVINCHQLVRREAILAGGSSGAVIAAVRRVKDLIPDGANCVAVLADRGERYLDTIYSHTWVMEHFGDIAHHWQEPEEVEECATAIY
jgi:2,3-diaminopropionate biosynthesis protein SbnA